MMRQRLGEFRAMAIETLGAALRQIDRLFGEGTSTGHADEQVLERFVARRDSAAFEVLVARHGPMVLSVCRGILRDPNDAEDAFQATFLFFQETTDASPRRESGLERSLGALCPRHGRA